MTPRAARLSVPAPRTVLAFVLALTAGGHHRAVAATHDGGPVPGSLCTTLELRRSIESQAFIAPGQRPQRNSISTFFEDPMGGGMNGPLRTIINYVDLDGATGVVRDWNCGSVTSDGHSGTDIEITDFFEMDEGVPILCAAPGIVIFAHDGEFDRSTAVVPGSVANHVIVRHADGTNAYYFHMRKGSVRVAVDQIVGVGDTLGMVGSSGPSSGPHLHFEIQESSSRLDPFQGPCQPLPTRWTRQGPYVMQLPAEVMTNGVTCTPLTWPVILEKPPSKIHVPAGKTIYSWIRARNFTVTDVLTWKFYANDMLFLQHSFSPTGTYSSSWWYTTITPPLGNYGNWRVDILRNGVLMKQQFFAYDAAPNLAPYIPNRVITFPTSWTWTDEFQGVDPDGSMSRYEVLTPPRQGTLVTFGGRNRKFKYSPNAGYVGRDTIIVRPIDDENLGGPAGIYAFNIVSSVDVDDGPAVGLPLAGIAPNPLSQSGEIGYTLAAPGRVTLDLFDLSGGRIRRLVNEEQGAGNHSAMWDARDARGNIVPPGIYFLRVTDARGAATRRFVVAR